MSEELKKIHDKYTFIEKLNNEDCGKLVAEIVFLLMQIGMSKDDEDKESLFERSIIGALQKASKLKNKV